MRTFTSTIILIIATSFHLNAQDSISVSDFRYPETRAIDLKTYITGGLGNNNYTMDDFRASPYYYPEYVNLSETHNRSLDLYATFLYFHSMENLDNTITLSGSYAPNWYDSYSGSHSMNVTTSRESHQVSQSFSPAARWQYASYFAESDFHILGKSGFSYNWDHSQTHQIDNLYPNIPINDNASTTNTLNLSTYWGVGYGRVREGSFVIEAMRIVDKLKEDGVITAPLTHDQWLSLIDRVAHEREYTTDFERYSKYLVKDILEALEASGVISKEKMSFYSTIKVTEVFGRPLQARFFGWRLYYILGPQYRENIYDNYFDYLYTSSSYSYHSVSYSHYFSKGYALMHSVGGEWGMPLSLYAHLYSEAHIELPTVGIDTKLNYFSNLTFCYELGEKVSLVGSYHFSDEKFLPSRAVNSDDYNRVITHRLTGELIIYLEDLINLTTSLNYVTSQTNSFYIPAKSYFMQGLNQSDMSVRFGVRFNII
jgi:hypothetical protein